MGIQILWDDDEKTILRYAFDADWTWEDFFKGFHQAKAMIDDAPGHVGVIFDVSMPTFNYPPNLLSHLKNALLRRHAKTKIVVGVIKNPFARMIAQSVMKITGKDGKMIYLCNSLDEARTLITDKLPYLE